MLLSLALAALLPVNPTLRCDPGDGVTAPREIAALESHASLAADSALVALYESGATFDAFLAGASARREMWLRNWAAAEVPADVLARAQAMGGRWRLLIVAVDGCSDSVNTVPYLARLSALVPSIELRIVQPGPGNAVMESHRTPDGRAATPTVVVLDERGDEAGCWIERPAALQEMAIKARAEGKIDNFQKGKQGWYDDDAGTSTLREVVAVIAAAVAGTPVCGSTPARTP